MMVTRVLQDDGFTELLLSADVVSHYASQLVGKSLANEKRGCRGS